MTARLTRVAESTTDTHIPPLSLEETKRLARVIVRKLHLPPGVTQADAVQEAMARLTHRSRDPRYAEGKRLHRRVWGDMLDLYGREWKKHYDQECHSHPAPHKLKDKLPSPLRQTGEPEPGLVMDVRAAIETLTPDQRAVVELVALEGLSHQDAAEKLGINAHAVTMRFARAKEALAEKLRAYA